MRTTVSLLIQRINLDLFWSAALTRKLTVIDFSFLDDPRVRVGLGLKLCTGCRFNGLIAPIEKPQQPYCFYQQVRKARHEVQVHPITHRITNLNNSILLFSVVTAWRPTSGLTSPSCCTVRCRLDCSGARPSMTCTTRNLSPTSSPSSTTSTACWASTVPP